MLYPEHRLEVVFQRAAFVNHIHAVPKVFANLTLHKVDDKQLTEVVVCTPGNTSLHFLTRF